MADDRFTLKPEDYPTRPARREHLTHLTPEERKARIREQNKRACERRSARKRAEKLGLEGPPLLAKPISSAEERRKRHAESERRRRANMGEEYRIKDRARNAKPERKAKAKEASKRRYETKKPKIIQQVTKWAKRNPDKVRQYAKTSRQRVLADPEKYAIKCAQRRASESKRMQFDEQFCITRNLRAAVKQALSLHFAGRKTRAIEPLIGCTVAEFVAHIEGLWETWMSWNNYGLKGFRPENGGRSWTLDHKKPCSSFDLTDTDQQKACFSYTNYQPLEFIENIRKRDRLDWKPSSEEEAA